MTDLAGLATPKGHPAVLRPGDVVRFIGDERWRSPTAERGVVLWSWGRGELPIVIWGGPLAENDAVIRVNVGHYVVTNIHHEWERIPFEQWTAEERVRSVSQTYEVPSWVEADEEPQENDSFAFALVRALLPKPVLDEVFDDNGDWPCSVHELVLQVAGQMDERDAWAERERRGEVFS